MLDQWQRAFGRYRSGAFASSPRARERATEPTPCRASRRKSGRWRVHASCRSSPNSTRGAERTAVDVAGGLAAVGARALVATEGGRLVGELQAKGGHWLRFPAASKNPASMAVNVLRLMALCRREKVQIIHARSRAPAWVALGAARRLGLPFVTTYHGSYSGRTGVKVLYNSVMARGDVVIANSHYTADLIHRLHAEQAGDRVRVIHRGTDLAVFNPVAVGAARVEALRRSWGVAPHERVILLAARLTAWKGHRVLIEAAAQMRDRGVPDLAVVLAGIRRAAPPTSASSTR